MLRREFLLTVLLVAPGLAQPRPTFLKVRYLGGTYAAKVNPFDWNTTITMTPTQLEFSFGPRQSLTVRFDQVTEAWTGAEAERRVTEVAGQSRMKFTPSLFGLLRGGKDHIIGFVYKTAEGDEGTLLLQFPRAVDDLVRRLREHGGK